MSFPIFPQFRLLSPLDAPAYLHVYAQNEPYSDFSFNNLLIWLDFNNDLMVSRHKDAIVLRFSNVFDNNNLAYTMLGNDNCLSTVEAIFDLQEKSGEPAHVTMVPECVLNNMLMNHHLPQNLLIKTDVANRDYVYDVTSALAMQGSNHRNIRRDIRLTATNFPDIKMGYHDLRLASTHQLLLNCLDTWRQNVTFTKNDPDLRENYAIMRYLHFSKVVPAQCLVLYQHKKVIGFAIFHRPPQKEWFIFNHIKCDPEYKFLFNYLYFLGLQEAKKQGVRYINLEQDLGLPGLREHKRQLRPARFLYRYELSRY